MSRDWAEEKTPINVIVKANLLYALASLAWLPLFMFDPMMLNGYILGVVFGSSVLAQKAKSNIVFSVLISLMVCFPLLLIRIFLIPFAEVDASSDSLTVSHAIWLLPISYHYLAGWLLSLYFKRSGTGSKDSIGS